jgi:hypothetical protein
LRKFIENFAEPIEKSFNEIAKQIYERVLGEINKRIIAAAMTKMNAKN